MQYLIKNARIITMDAQDTVYENGCLLTQDDRIAYVGDASGCPDVPEACVYDAKDGIVLPGFINTHTHIPMTLLRGVVNDLPLHAWLDHIFALEAHLTEEDVYWGALCGMAEMLRGGCTLFNDMYYFTERMAQAVQETGMRGVLSRGILGSDQEAFDKIDQVQDTIRACDGMADGRVRIRLGMHAEYTCSEALLRYGAEKAKDWGVGIHIHVSETVKEVEECIGRHNLTPVAYLNKLGVFDVPTSAAHCVVLHPGDIEILAQKRVAALHNPGSNCILASGFSPVPEMLRAGVNVSIGTDGPGSNNNLDMLQEIYLAAVLHKATHRDATCVSASQALRLGTMEGAVAVGQQQDIGSLEVGKKADLSVVDTSKSTVYAPKGDPHYQIVYAASSGDMDLTMVDGKVLVEHGEFKTIDIDRVKFETNRISQKLRALAGEN
nr:amidohydrolase [Maliibacterium massiliense]